jgi:hypothetical protein
MAEHSGKGYPTADRLVPFQHARPAQQEGPVVLPAARQRQRQAPAPGERVERLGAQTVAPIDLRYTCWIFTRR